MGQRSAASGASLKDAQLQGASLAGAQLQGASLAGAQLQGTDFGHSTFAGTNMGNAAVWYMSFEGASLAAVSEDNLNPKAISKDEFVALKAYIMKEVSEGIQREAALDRIEKLNPDKLNPDIIGPETSQTQALEKGRAANEAAYQKALADDLKSLVCSGDESASYIVRGLVDTRRISHAGPFAPGLIEDILAPGCPVSTSLTEQDKANLRKLAKEAQLSASKQ